MQIVKLGGSVITDKASYRAYRAQATARLAREIASCDDDVVVVHGAGSFGHILAKKHSLRQGYKSRSQLPGVSQVQRDVRELNLLVMKALQDAGLQPVSMPPSCLLVARGGKIPEMSHELFRAALEDGFTPVTFGDVVPDSRQKFTVCSGDTLMQLLATSLGAKQAIFATNVDGIFGGSGQVIRRLRSIKEIGAMGSPGKSRTPKDVTGGIYGKAAVMLQIAKAGIPTALVNGCAKGRLAAALRGKKPLGTYAMTGASKGGSSL